MMKRIVVLMSLACAGASISIGTEYSYNCKTPRCGFEGSPLEIGHYDLAGHISGYCWACKKFVSIRWKDKAVPKDVSTNLAYAPPQKLATVWNPVTGHEIILYPSPECKGPFIQIDESCLLQADGKTFTFCPRCGKHSLKLSESLKFP